MNSTLNSDELAARHGLSRDQMEALLVSFGLRDRQHDGSNRYDPARVQALMDLQDRTRLSEAAVFFDPIINQELAGTTVREVLGELLDRLLRDIPDLESHVKAAKDGLLSRIRETFAFRRAQQADRWEQLELLQRFRDEVLQAIHSRRTPPKPAESPQPAESPAKARGKRAGRQTSGNIQGDPQ